MLLVRPVKMNDLEQLVELARKAKFGLTWLPKNADIMAGRIRESIRSFSFTVEKPGGELYVFVMEDLAARSIVGTACILSKVGGFEPFYAYKIETRVHESKALHIRKEVTAMNLVAEHSGPSEIGGLYLDPEYRKHGAGRLLSLFRFLFMAEHQTRFEPLILAEMRGVVDDDGTSPFWDAVGRHFFEMEYPKADVLSAQDKQFIAELMPTCPIYVNLLPEAAQAVIRKVHPRTEPALKLLRDEGFEISDLVDIFEAGPIVFCRLDEVRIVKESKVDRISEITDETIESPPQIIINPGKEFCAAMDGIEETAGGGVKIGVKIADALNLHVGARVRYGPAKPSRK
jgi:arginine N-succinyltransferase